MADEKPRESPWSLRLLIIAMLCSATSGILRVTGTHAWTGAAVAGLVIAAGSLLVMVVAVVLLYQRRHHEEQR